MSVRRVEIIGNLDKFAVGERVLERLGIRSEAMARRIVRLETSIGDVGIRLSDGKRLRDGDVIFADAQRVLAVEVIPDDVLVVRPRTIAEAVAVAHALGNRHLPVLQEGDAVLVQFAPALEELVRGLGVPFERRHVTVPMPFRHADAPHAH